MAAVAAAGEHESDKLLARPYVKLSAIYMWENGNTQLSENTNTLAGSSRGFTTKALAFANARQRVTLNSDVQAS
jgi:hypothetical protein